MILIMKGKFWQTCNIDLNYYNDGIFTDMCSVNKKDNFNYYVTWLQQLRKSF
jgi:hypothetical protein